MSDDPKPLTRAEVEALCGDIPWERIAATADALEESRAELAEAEALARGMAQQIATMEADLHEARARANGAFERGQRDGADNVRASEQCEECTASLLPLPDGSLPSWFCVPCWNSGIARARELARREALEEAADWVDAQYPQSDWSQRDFGRGLRALATTPSKGDTDVKDP